MGSGYTQCMVMEKERPAIQWMKDVTALMGLSQNDIMWKEPEDREA